MHDDAIKVKVRLDFNAYPPSRAHAYDGGLDLRAMESGTIPAGGFAEFDTGVHLDIPVGYAGILMSRSGLNRNRGITTTGLIDSGYTGTVMAIVHNDSSYEQSIVRGDKITQVVFVKIPKVTLVLDECQHECSRDNAGFGSSGR